MSSIAGCQKKVKTGSIMKSKMPAGGHLSPEGDIGLLRQKEALRVFATNPIKGNGPTIAPSGKTTGAGGGARDRGIPKKSLGLATGAPSMRESQVTPGIGAAKTSSNSVAWKAVVCKDETMTGQMTNAQVLNVDGSLGQEHKGPSKFKANVRRFNGGQFAIDSDEGINIRNWGPERIAQYKATNLDGQTDQPRTKKWAARVGVHPMARTSNYVQADETLGNREIMKRYGEKVK